MVVSREYENVINTIPMQYIPLYFISTNYQKVRLRGKGVGPEGLGLGLGLRWWFSIFEFVGVSGSELYTENGGDALKGNNIQGASV